MLYQLNKLNHLKWLWYLSLMNYNYIFILDRMKLSDGLASSPNDNQSSTFGWMNPVGDVFILVGKPLNIFCTINMDNDEARKYRVNLSFQKDEELLYVTKVNKTTISLHLLNQKISDSVYKCYLTLNKSILKTSIEPRNSSNGSTKGSEVLIKKNNLEVDFNNSFQSEILIGHVRVSVGEGPQKVENFDCMSYNWNQLSCTWVLPRMHCFQSNYTIHYVPQNSTSTNTFSCPWLDHKTACARACVWSAGTNPPYYHDFENLKITIVGVNKFDKIEQSFNFNKFKHIKPDPPSSLLSWSESASRIRLRWELNDPKGLSIIPINWTCEIKLESDFKYTRSIICASENITQDNIFYFYVVTNLRPKTKYHLSVRIKSPQAPLEDKYWSDYSNEHASTTEPLLGPIFPETDNFLFEIVDKSNKSRAVNIFWKPVINKDLYDDVLKYKIDLYNVDQASNKVLVQSKVRQVDSNDFRDAYIIGYSSYQFVITSDLSESTTLNASFINVPAAHDGVKSCPLLYVISRDYYNKTITFECIWKPPEKTNIVSYTLFWYLLEFNIINWIRIPVNTTKHQIAINNYLWTDEITFDTHQMRSIRGFPQKRPQFYISANTKYSSSGLVQMHKIHAVSHVWKTEWFLSKKRNSTKKPIPKIDSERVTYNGWKFSPNQFQKWMNKVYSTEDKIS